MPPANKQDEEPPMPEPGDASEDAKQWEFDRLQRLATEKWGADRAAAIEPSLRQAAASIARLELLRFSRDDAPAFYLHETAPEPDRD